MTGYAESAIRYITKEVCQEIVKVLLENDVTALFPKKEEQNVNLNLLMRL